MNRSRSNDSLGPPGAAELELATARETSRQPEDAPSPPRTEHEAGAPGGGDQHLLRQRRLKSAEWCGGEGDAVRLRARVETRKCVEHMVPGIAIAQSLGPECQQPCVHVRKPTAQLGEDVTAQPGTEVCRVAVRWICPDRESPGTGLASECRPGKLSSGRATNPVTSRMPARPAGPEPRSARMRIVSTWSSAWCAVNTTTAPRRVRSASSHAYLATRATVSAVPAPSESLPISHRNPRPSANADT